MNVKSFFEEMNKYLRSHPCEVCAEKVREKYNDLPPDVRATVSANYLALMRTR